MLWLIFPSATIVRSIFIFSCLTLGSQLYVGVTHISPAPVAQWVECPLLGTGGHGFDPGPRHTKVVKNGTSCSSLGTQSWDWSTQCQDTVTGCGIMSSAWGMILQWGSTIKVSIELLVATRHRRDMTEKLLKATLNPNKQQQQQHFCFGFWFDFCFTALRHILGHFGRGQLT